MTNFLLESDKMSLQLGRESMETHSYINSENGANISDRDSGVSTTSGDYISTGSGEGYECVTAKNEEETHLIVINDDDCDVDDDGVSIEIEEGDSVFDSDQECSSLSVSDSESERNIVQNDDGRNTPNRQEFSKTYESVRVLVGVNIAKCSCNQTHENSVTSVSNGGLNYYNTNEPSGMLPHEDNVESCDIQTSEGIPLLSAIKSEFDYSNNNEIPGAVTCKGNVNILSCETSEISTTFANKNDLGCSKTDELLTILTSQDSQNGVCIQTKDNTVTTAKNQSELSSVCPDSVNLEHHNSFYRNAQDNVGVNTIKSDKYGADFSPAATGLKSSETNKRSNLHTDSSLDFDVTRKRTFLSQSGAERSKGVISISPYVIEGLTLHVGWVDRVNKVIADNAQNVVSSYNEDIIKRATNCKIMKKWSEKERKSLNRPPENLRRRSPSDARHDRRKESSTETINNYDSLFSSHECVRKAEGMITCSQGKSNILDALESMTFPADASNSDKEYANDATMDTKTIRPRISGRPLLISQQPVSPDEILTSTHALSPTSEHVMECCPSVQEVNTSAAKGFTATNEDFNKMNLSCGDISSDIKNYNKETNDHDLVYRTMEPAHVSPENNADISTHGLIRKPAVRRKGYAWMSKNSPKNAGSDLINRQGHRKLCQGSSLELAPSLLNLYDDRVSSRGRDEDNSDNHTGDRTITKSQSLPVSTGEDSIDRVHYRSGKLLSPKLPPDRSMSLMDSEPTLPKCINALVDNKKRPLSISSVSSTSLTSSPRLRKKRASTFHGGDAEVVRESSQDSSCTLVANSDSGSRVVCTSDSRHSVDSGCIEGDKNGDRYLDNMSVTSSETGSGRDETDSSGKDCSVMPSSLSDRFNHSQPSHPTVGSNIQSSSIDSPTSAGRNGNTATLITSSPQSPASNKQTTQITSPEHGNKPRAVPEPRSPNFSVSGTEYDTSSSPKNAGYTASSSYRHEARMRFFSNYEEHMKQSSPTQAPIAEENFEIPPSPSTHSPNEISPLQQSSSEAASSAAVTRTENPKGSSSRHSSRESASSPTSGKPEHRRDRSSQYSPSSEKTSRRSDRHGSVSKHDRQPASPRSGLSRNSKRRDPLTSDHGSRSSPVYVTYVSRVVMEIIESERIYIASLEDIIHGYLEPMEKILGSDDAKKDVECLFSNIRDIYNFGCLFLGDLEMAGVDPVKVAQCFVKYNKGFVIYSDYCTNYPRAVEVLTRFMQHPDLSQLCKERQLALGHGLPLGAYLLKPVQRILKYHLLLHNIVKNCEKEKEEATILERAFHHMTQMAHHINEMKRKHEHAVRIQEIQSQLEDYVGEDLTRLGELVLEGTFKVSGAKASRQVFLFERGLLISKMKEGGMLSCKTFIRCSNLMLVEVIPNEPLSFHIIPFDNPRAQDTLQARTMEQKRRWCHDIKQQILESFKGRIPDNAKNLIMQLGKDYDDDYISKDALDAGRRNQHTVPEYLEKRRFRRKSGSRLPDFSLLKPQKAKKSGNKKSEVKSGEKMSAVRTRRSESKSPEGHRGIFSRQNVTTKRRSQSTSSTVSLSTLSSTPLHDKSPANSDRAITRPATKTLEHSSLTSACTPPKSACTSPKSACTSPKSACTSPKSSCTSPESPVYRRSPKTFTHSKDGKEEAEAEVIKRPVSFLMARANPILSEDITHILARCRVPRKMQGSPLLEDENEKTFPSAADFPDMGRISMKNISDLGETFSDNYEPNVVTEENKQVNNTKSSCNGPLLAAGDNIHSSNSSENTSLSLEVKMLPYNTGLDQNVKESRRSDSKSISLPDLNKTVKAKDLRESGGGSTEANDSKNKNTSQSAKNMFENDNISKARSRMSRKDMQYTSQNFRRKGKVEDNSENNVDKWKKESEVKAFDGTHKKKSRDSVIMGKKILRLPNTSKLLSAKEYGPNQHTDEIRFDLTHSGEILNWVSVDELSHMDENSWVIDSAVTRSRSSMDAESLGSSRPSLLVTRRPRGHSDVTEMIQVSNNKENLDLWRKNRIPTLLHRCSVGNQNVETEVKFSSQVPYATPPREYMTFENMKRLGSVKDSDRHCFPYQDLSDNSFSNSALVNVNAFGVSPVTVTVAKPVSFSASNLSRSNSTPIPSERFDSAAKASSKERPISMDVDKLTEESNRLVAEMEEYINNSSDNVKCIKKFPTSLPAIPVQEEEAGSNRLSVVSSISTSSYESHDSSSSDGLVGTLKCKLRAWARIRKDSEFSYASTFTSDDEDQEEFMNSESGSALELHIKNRSSWKNDKELETVNFEHSLECAEQESCMACPLTPLPAEHIVSYQCTDFSARESHPQGTVDLDYVDLASERSDKLPLGIENQLEQGRCSLLNTTENTQTLMPPALNNNEIHSDSEFFLKSSVSNVSDPYPLKNEVVLDAVLDLLEASSIVTAPLTKHLMDANTPAKEASDLTKSDSYKLPNSDDSYCERKSSAAVGSETVREKLENCDHDQQENVEVPLPRKSIREYVQDFEEKQRALTQKVTEVKRREPGIMIRQRLETFRESALQGWRNSSHSSSRPPSEERDFSRSKTPPPVFNRIPVTVKKDEQSDTSITSMCTKLMGSRSNLSKSVENLSKSWESIYLSRSRDSLNTISDVPCNRHSIPVCALKSNNPGHEKYANRFYYKVPEHNQTLSGNQFIHRAKSDLEQCMPGPEISSFTTADVAPMQASKSMCQLDGSDNEGDNLVLMKGWVRALISKFQNKE